MQHYRHSAGIRIKAMSPQRCTVCSDLVGKVIHVLTDQMSENPRPDAARKLKGIYASECREPDRQFGLHWTRQNIHCSFLPVYSGKFLCFTAPELADSFNPFRKL